MHELTDRLESLGQRQAPSPEQATVDADLRRGRVALGRRRRRQGAAGIAAVAALAIVGVSVAATTGGGGTRRASNGTASSTLPTNSRAGTHNTLAGRHNTHTGTHVASVRLVAYKGTQLAGFTVAKVPAGYVLQGAQPTTLDIAQPGNHTSIDSFVDKVVVSLQSTDATTPTTGKHVKVNGEPGIITDSDGVHTLWYTDGSHEVQVQAWSNIHLTDDQLVTFAEGVTVTSAVQPTHG
jgi:hypothetical protein